jgi:hypothetical protein
MKSKKKSIQRDKSMSFDFPNDRFQSNMDEQIFDKAGSKKNKKAKQNKLKRIHKMRKRYIRLYTRRDLRRLKTTACQRKVIRHHPICGGGFRCFAWLKILFVFFWHVFDKKCLQNVGSRFNPMADYKEVKISVNRAWPGKICQ